MTSDRQGPTPSDAAPAPAAAPRSRPRGMGGSARNMVFSMLAVLGLAMAWWALMPPAEQSGTVPAAVDVPPVARYASEEGPWPVWVPQDLPQGWRATSVRYEPHTDGVLSWRVGYQSPGGEFVALDQAAGATEGWVDAAVGAEPSEGTVDVDGPGGRATWDRYASPDQNALVLAPPGGPEDVTTVVRGTATFAELEDFIGHLEPWEAPSN